MIAQEVEPESARDEKIGGFATCRYLLDKSPTMSFVAGRTQVRLSADGDWAPDDPKQYDAMFTPIARRMVGEVRRAIGQGTGSRVRAHLTP